MNKRHHSFSTSTSILVDIKANLRSNSDILNVNSTKRAAKIDVLDDCAYPVFRLLSNGVIKITMTSSDQTVIAPVGKSNSIDAIMPNM